MGAFKKVTGSIVNASGVTQNMPGAMPEAPEMTAEGRAKADAAAKEEIQRKRGKAAQLVFGGNTIGTGSSSLLGGSGGSSMPRPPTLTGF